MADGSYWLTLEATDDEPASYAPGHVLSLGLEDAGGSLRRHAYTVSSGEAGRRRFSHLYRVIPNGRLTPRLAELASGDALYFHGPFHTPIEEEVDPPAQRIVGVATGTGIGPLFGFAAKVLDGGEQRPIALYASFRRPEDMALEGELSALRRRYPNFRFSCSLTAPPPGWTGPVGRVQHVVPGQLTRLEDTHIHLVGRGDMVHLWKNAWIRAGLGRHRVSIETYFNHHAVPDEEEAAVLARALRARVGSTAGA